MTTPKLRQAQTSASSVESSSRGLRGIRAAVVAAWLAAAGCVPYRAAPLDPARDIAAFSSRRLNDPALLALVGYAPPPEGVAASQPATRPGAVAWDLETLSRAALRLHPDMAVAAAHVAAVRAGEVTAGEMPNPTVGFAPQFSTNPGDVSPWTVGLTFDIPIETAGKREDRIAQAKALTAAARLDLAAAAWRVRSRLRDALAEYLFDGREAELWATEVDARTTFVRLVEARLQAGEAGRAELNTARVDLLTARQSRRASEGKLADARAKLAAAVGVPTAGLEGADFVWPGLDQFAPADSFADRLQTDSLVNRIDVRRALAEYAAAEAALRLEIAKQYPDLHLGPGYTFDQGQNKWELGATVTLPILNQNGGAIAEATAKRAELAAKFAALQAQVIGDTESAAARFRSALAELEEAGGQVESLTRQREAGRRALEIGEQDRLTVVALDIQYGVAARLRLDALRKAQGARGATEDLIQRPLVSSPAGGLVAPPGAVNKDVAP